MLDIARPQIYLRRHAERRLELPDDLRRAGQEAGDPHAPASATTSSPTRWRCATAPSGSPSGGSPTTRSRARAATARSARRSRKTWPEVRMTKEGPKRTRRWTHLELRAPWVRIAHPDSAGQLIDLALLSAVESDPPTVAQATCAARCASTATRCGRRSRTSTSPAPPARRACTSGGGATSPTQLDVTRAGRLGLAARFRLGVREPPAHGRRQGRGPRAQRSPEPPRDRLRAEEHGPAHRRTRACAAT